MRDIDNEIIVNNVSKPDEYCYPQDEFIHMVNVDPDDDDEMDEEIQALVESITKVDTSKFGPDED